MKVDENEGMSVGLAQVKEVMNYDKVDEVEEMAKALFNTPREEEIQVERKKAEMPPAEQYLAEKEEPPFLTSFIQRESWLMFDIFDVDVLWMQYPPSNWNQSPEYQRFYGLLNGLICVNDVAERNVQNVCQYAEFSKDSERRDRVVKVVNSHREMVDFSDLTKAELSKL